MKNIENSMDTVANNGTVEKITKDILNKHLKAFEELAKSKEDHYEKNSEENYRE